MRQTVIFILALVSGAAVAAGPIGRVVQTSGLVTADADVLTMATELRTGMRLVSGKDGSVTLRMADDSLIRINGATDLSIRDFAFSPATSATRLNSAGYDLNYGALRIISGRSTPAGGTVVTLHTPFGDVIANSADYSAGICAGDCAQAPGLYVCMQSGQANARSSDSTTVLRSGQASYSAGPQEEARILNSCPTFMAEITGASLRASLDVQTLGEPRLRREAQDFLSGVIDPPASPSQPPATTP